MLLKKYKIWKKEVYKRSKNISCYECKYFLGDSYGCGGIMSEGFCKAAKFSIYLRHFIYVPI